MCVWKQVATLILDVADVMGDDYMTKGEIGVFKHEWIDLTESRKTIADRYNPCQHLCRQSLSKLTVFAPKSALSVQSVTERTGVLNVAVIWMAWREHKNICIRRQITRRYMATSCHQAELSGARQIHICSSPLILLIVSFCFADAADCKNMH